MGILNEFFVLNNGVKIPKLSLGTWQMSDEQAYNSVKFALKNGYRHIDTATAYGNEAAVGRAVNDSGIAREEIYVTTKVPAEFKTYEQAAKSIDESLKLLDTQYIDLILIHAPKPWNEMYANLGIHYYEENVKVYKALEEALEAGKVKSIGVSNFDVKDLQNLQENCKVTPAANQIKFCIGHTDAQITKYCQDKGILVEGYSPLCHGTAFESDIVAKLAEKYSRTISQICLRYLIQRNVLPIPKSTHEEYILQNADLDFVISEEDIVYLDSLDEIFRNPFA